MKTKKELTFQTIESINQIVQLTAVLLDKNKPHNHKVPVKIRLLLAALQKISLRELLLFTPELTTTQDIASDLHKLAAQYEEIATYCMQQPILSLYREI